MRAVLVEQEKSCTRLGCEVPTITKGFGLSDLESSQKNKLAFEGAE